MKKSKINSGLVSIVFYFLLISCTGVERHLNPLSDEQPVSKLEYTVSENPCNLNEKNQTYNLFVRIKTNNSKVEYCVPILGSQLELKSHFTFENNKLVSENITFSDSIAFISSNAIQYDCLRIV